MPRHGYDIARWIRETTDAELQVEDRALYVSLHRMEERGWLEAEWGLTDNNRNAKYYQLTREGRKQLAAKTATWSRYAAAVVEDSADHLNRMGGPPCRAYRESGACFGFRSPKIA